MSEIWYFVRDLVAEKVIKFEWTSSETNSADVFTKPLGRIAFERCVGRIMVSEEMVTINEDID